MFTITTCTGTWKALICRWQGLSPALLIPDVSGLSKVLHCGTPVKTIPGFNSMGDNSCSHINVKGNIVMPPQSSTGWTKQFHPSVSTSTVKSGAYTEYRRVVTPYTARVSGFFQDNGSYHNFGYKYVDNYVANLHGWQVDTLMTYDMYCGFYPNTMYRKAWWIINWWTSNTNKSLSSVVPFVYEVQTFLVSVNPTTQGTTVYTKTQGGLHLSNPVSTVPAWNTSGMGLSSGPSLLPFGYTEYTKADVYAVRDRVLAYSRATESRYLAYSPLWDSLAWTAVNNMQAVSVNSLAYVADLVKLASSIIQICRGNFGQIWDQIKDLSVKGFANKWLEGRYGLRLTALDSESLLKSVLSLAKRKYPISIVRAAETWDALSGPYGSQKLHANYKVYYAADDDPVHQLVKSSWEWDVAPTLANVWDLVPLSFVLDWALNIQERLTYLDNLNYLGCISIKGVCKSFKTDPITIAMIDVPPGLTMTYYRRLASPQLDSIRMPSLFPDSGRIINIVDGLSLIISLLN